MVSISLEQYLAEAQERDEQDAKQEELNKRLWRWEWMDLDFLDQVWRIRPTVKGWCDAILEI